MQVIQRNLLPVARHREVVVDAAKRLNDPVTASDNQWIQAIYHELEGEGNPGADRCIEGLIHQRIIDQDDWNVIRKDFLLYKAKKGAGFDLFERHGVPRVHNEQEADKWVATLIENRINDLYITLEGFYGHAQQVQLGITSLVGWYEAGQFNKAAYDKYKQKIIDALKTGKANCRLQIPKYVYTFEDGSVTAV